jgi:hypothetical protein
MLVYRDCMTTLYQCEACACEPTENRQGGRVESFQKMVVGAAGDCLNKAFRQGLFRGSRGPQPAPLTIHFYTTHGQSPDGALDIARLSSQHRRTIGPSTPLYNSSESTIRPLKWSTTLSWLFARYLNPWHRLRSAGNGSELEEPIQVQPLERAPRALDKKHPIFRIGR